MSAIEQSDLTPAQQHMVALWDAHTQAEFETSSIDDTLETMVPDAYVNHVPVMTGGYGIESVGKFYSTHFIPQQPPDTEFVLVSRTVGTNRIVDELIHKFTHSIQMDWLLPGVPPTGKRVEIAVAAVVNFQDGKILSEHIYWDQASVLVQVGLLDGDDLPVVGVESSHKVLDPSLPSNQLIYR